MRTTLDAGHERAAGVLDPYRNQHHDDRDERRLLRADLDNSPHLDEMLLYKKRLSRPQSRRLLGLNRYGRKLERIMDALLRL